MTLTNQQTSTVENVLRGALRNKFLKYKPEPAAMPFHIRLLGKDRLALFSFIHSLNTNFGTSIFEPVALALAKSTFKSAQAQAIAGEHISTEAFKVIQEIMTNLSTAKGSPDKSIEIDKIRAVCQKGEMTKVKPTRVDVLLESYNGELFLFDIKTAK
ncbi:MAG TPA: TdeIII family type II restriction endonuclease, partial [Pyrinomonadaceae bacterium]